MPRGTTIPQRRRESMAKNTYERCAALTDEDKARNLDSEEIEYCGEDFDDEEIREEQDALDHVSTSNFSNQLFREQLPQVIRERGC